MRVKITFKHWAGAQMLSTVVTTMLFGVALFFLMRYLSSHARNDPISIKVLVWVLAILATLETAFANHQMYQYFITEHDLPDRGDVIHESITGKTACIILTAFFSQLFYADRIWKVGRNLNSPLRYSVIPILGLAITQLGGGLIQVFILARSKTFTILNSLVYYNLRSMYIHGSCTAACDILITASLVLILRTSAVDSTRRTRNLLHSLTIYAINRGIVTSFLALSSILLYDFASGTLYYIIPFSANTHVYVISVVSLLTAREGLREKLHRPFHLSDLMPSTQAKSTKTSGNTASALESQQPPNGNPSPQPH